MNTAFLPENKWNDNRNVDENEPTLFDLYEQGDFKSLRRKILQRNDLNAPCGEGEELLFVLAQNNNEDDALQAALTADLLLKKGVDPNAYDTDVCTPLIYAIISNNLKLAACLISAGADVNRAADGPPLMHAQTLEALTFLLENGADPNRRNFYGSTPILSICENFEPELYEKAFSLLLKYGADPNVRNYFGQTLVCRVVQSRCELNTLRFIVEELEGDFYTPDFDGFPPVFFTGSHVDSEIFHYLVEQGADVFCVTKNERTLLYHVLCTFSNTKLAHELIETYHFDVNARPSGLMTLLQLIPTRVPTEEAKEMMRFLIAHGAHVLPHDSGWSFVIMMLLQNRKLELFDFLLDELGVDFNVWYAESYSSYTVLESAVSWKFSMEFIQELVQKQHPNQMHFNAALAQAVEQNDFALVEYFVTQGADPQAGVERVGPYTDIEILQLLYQNGADLNEHSHFKKGETLLHRGNFEMIQFLVEEAGLDIFTLDAAGHTPLYHAVKRKNFEIAEYLLERGAAAGIDTHELLFPAIETQLVQSDLSERFSFFRTLMEVGAKINVQNSGGETPLMLAAQIGDSEAVRFLLANGADPAIQNKQGENVLFYADETTFPILLYEAKLDPHAANAAGESVLFHLVEAFPLDSLQRILPLADFDLHAIDAHGRSLLFPAAMNYGHFSLNFEVFYWLEKTQGLDPKIHDKTGKSLLHAAILDEYLPTFIQYLVEVAGLDPNEPDAEGRTPIQEAEALGDALLIQYLRNSKNTIYTRST